MTLYIKLNFSKELPNRKGILLVEGSQAGGLVTAFRKNNYTWEPPFQIVCSRKDILTFKICEEQKASETETVVAIGRLKVPVLIQCHQQSLGMNEQNPLSYVLDLFQKQGEDPACFLHMKINYDKKKLYYGQISGGLSLKQQNSRLPLYLGKCPTKNLFSVLDDSVENQSYQRVEDIYRD